MDLPFKPNRISFSQIKETCKCSQTYEEVLEKLGLSEEDIDEAVSEYIKNEINTAGAVAPITTPKAFKKKNIKKESISDPYEHYLTEISYLDFKNSTPRSKIRNTTKEISKKLREIDNTLNHITRLKSESGLDGGKLTPNTRRYLSTIKERLVSIVKKIKELEE